jgi:hypothetical protein
MLLFYQHLRKLVGCLAAWVVFVDASFLEVATIHTLQIPRYMTVQMYFAILAQFLAFWLISEVVLELLPHAQIESPDSRIE